MGPGSSTHPRVWKLCRIVLGLSIARSVVLMNAMLGSSDVVASKMNSESSMAFSAACTHIVPIKHRASVTASNKLLPPF